MRAVNLDRFFALRHTASTHKGRHAICGIRVNPDGSCAATDGRMLFVTDGDECGADEALECAAPEKPVTISIASVKDAKRLYKPRRFGPQDALHFNGKATLRAEAGASSLTLREEDGEFPDVNAVMPQGDTAFAVTLSAEVVENLCKLAKDMGDRMPTFTLEFTKLNMSDAACETAIRVVIDDRTRGAIMPVKKT